MAGHSDRNESELINTTFIPTEATRSAPSSLRPALQAPSQHFEFIHLSHDAPITDARARQRVRSHAMRDFRRRKGLPDMFDEQEVVQFSSPETAVASPASIELQNNDGDPADHDLRRVTPANQPRGSSEATITAPLIQVVQDMPLSGQTETREAIGTVGQQATRLSSRPKRVACELPDVDRKTTSLPSNSPISFPHGDGDGKSRDPSNATLEAQKRTRSKALTLVRVPSAASFDPFNAIPVISTERVRVLVHYCKMTSF